VMLCTYGNSEESEEEKESDLVLHDC
jgi:hypothetical protein